MRVTYDDDHGPWTKAEVLSLGEDRRRRRELIGDSLLVTPRPATRHQRALSRLRRLLESAASAAGASPEVEVFGAANIVLPGGLFVPDIVVVDVTAADRDMTAFGSDAVRLVVEIVSPSATASRIDRLLKPPYYAEAGIEHLWRLELEPSPVLVVAALEAGRYVDRVVARAGSRTLVEKPFAVEVDPGALVPQRG
ncbi:Uma2 family endonuclease [Streptomyces sp. HPF1205]|uniref:Uma2 family endonuclease n=1 Tax=Streptomyces sp. HPF1205 TaxID=2873262 RepID=UPI001CECEFC0|nr:Uma2 family endonuclease [Streptomyces sp. HPF1205]